MSTPDINQPQPKFKKEYAIIIGVVLAVAAIFAFSFAAISLPNASVPLGQSADLRAKVRLVDGTPVAVGDLAISLKGKGRLSAAAFPLLQSLDSEYKSVVDVFVSNQEVAALYIPEPSEPMVEGLNVKMGTTGSEVKAQIPSVMDQHPYLDRFKHKGLVWERAQDSVIFLYYQCDASDEKVVAMAVVQNNQAAVDEVAKYIGADLPFDLCEGNTD